MSKSIQAALIGWLARARIVTFRAAHLTFNALDTGEFVAVGQCSYALTPAIGSAEWDLAIGDDEHPKRFPSLDAALQNILDVLFRQAVLFNVLDVAARLVIQVPPDALDFGHFRRGVD